MSEKEKPTEWEEEKEAIKQAETEIKNEFADVPDAQSVDDILTRDKRPKEVLDSEPISERGKRIVNRLFDTARDNVFKSKNGIGREGPEAADNAVDEGLNRKADFGDFTVVAVDIMNLGGKNKKSTHKEANRGLQVDGQILDDVLEE